MTKRLFDLFDPDLPHWVPLAPPARQTIEDVFPPREAQMLVQHGFCSVADVQWVLDRGEDGFELSPATKRVRERTGGIEIGELTRGDLGRIRKAIQDLAAGRK